MNKTMLLFYIISSISTSALSSSENECITSSKKTNYKYMSQTQEFKTDHIVIFKNTADYDQRYNIVYTNYLDAIQNNTKEFVIDVKAGQIYKHEYSLTNKLYFKLGKHMVESSNKVHMFPDLIMRCHNAKEIIVE
jgi:hypothetical protein